MTYVAAGESIPSSLTRYGERFNGRKMGCSKLGYYSSDDPTIVAVGYDRHAEMPCGTLLEVCGPTGCHLMMRKDTCGGCSAYMFDLSEAGNALVCGESYGLCNATVTKVVPNENVEAPPPESPAPEPAPPEPAPDATPPDEATQLSYLLTMELQAPPPEAPAAPVDVAGGIATP